MRIKKVGHACLIAEIDGKKFITDPGSFTESQDLETGICAVLISHEHPDHFSVESVKHILMRNRDAVIVTNGSVGKVLHDEGIPYKKVEDGETVSVNGILVEAHGDIHAHIYDTIPPLQNTGYLIDNTFFYPGDAFYNPGKDVNVLALPVSGPWMKISEAIDYLRLLKPKICIPVHDGALIPSRRGIIDKLSHDICSEYGAQYVELREGEEHELFVPGLPEPESVG